MHGVPWTIGYGGYENDRHALECFAPGQFLGKGETVLCGHNHVQKDQIRYLRLQLLASFVSAARRTHVVPCPLQQSLGSQQIPLVVVNKQDCPGHGNRSFSHARLESVGLRFVPPPAHTY